MRLALVLPFLMMLTAPALAAPHLHHILEVTLDPATRQLSVVDRVRAEGGAMPDLTVAPGFTVTRRQATDDGVTLEYQGTLPPLAPEADTAQAGPEGAFLPNGSGWFPHAEGELGSYVLTVTVPSPLVAVATGRLEDEVTTDGRYRATFREERPLEEPSLFAGPYRVRERMEGNLRLRAYLPEDLIGLADDLLADTARHIARYQEEIGPYPYAGFAIVSGAHPVGYGFPGLTYVSRQVLPLPFFRGQSLAHEILHNWWGNGIAVDYASGNWAEGLTTYMADHALRNAGAASEMRLAWLRDYAALPTSRDRALASFRTKTHDADQVVGYNKAAFVFHMLKERLGEERFSWGVRLFWWENRFRAAGWADLRHAFEAAAQEDLSTFFRQWLEQPGAPRLALTSAEPGVLPGGLPAVTVTVSQTAPVYELDVPLWIETDQGGEEHRLRLTGETTTDTIKLNAQPRSLTVDRDHDLFRALRPGEAPPILRDVTLAAKRSVVLAGGGTVAETLATRLLGGEARPVAVKEARAAKAPILLVGIYADVEAARAALGLGPVPAEIGNTGTARVWVERDDRGRAALTVAGADATALEALIRPLPHYVRQSWLVFEGRQAVEKGVWSADLSALTKRFK
ncbi:MAG TPA: M1 family aminopeptidase [Azospirillaceae bacterium]|nr:M1 family aminopeptidase [Azospirillaceae bacterium]